MTRWRKSSHSGGSQDCVEVRRAGPATLTVRDSKNPQGRILVLDTDTWRKLTAKLRAEP
ncbi:DUF397 domain-containing protein [Actinomadura hibisca]|uniref:DUF397 domain-containing protein n=1 Tax=Actinomadura hibisca TaxID=68565 RepID=UPI000A07033F|nr:DUF397 domain-containing protein [Actinomadura hibisca]